jgi:hypothetical protein
LRGQNGCTTGCARRIARPDGHASAGQQIKPIHNGSVTPVNRAPTCRDAGDADEIQRESTGKTAAEVCITEKPPVIRLRKWLQHVAT